MEIHPRILQMIFHDGSLRILLFHIQNICQYPPWPETETSTSGEPLAIMATSYGCLARRMAMISGEITNDRNRHFIFSVTIQVWLFMVPKSWPPVMSPRKNKKGEGMIVRTIISFPRVICSYLNDLSGEFIIYYWYVFTILSFRWGPISLLKGRVFRVGVSGQVPASVTINQFCLLLVNHLILWGISMMAIFMTWKRVDIWTSMDMVPV